MSNPFDQFDAPAAEGGNPFDQFDAPAAKKLPSKGILSDVGGAFVEGAKSAGRAIAGTANIYAGDESALVEKAQAQESAQAQKPAALTAFNQAVTERVKPLGDDPGLLDSVKAIGGAVVDQPKGAGLAVVEQLPNAAPAIAGGMAGMKAGAALGTAIMPGVGTTIGAIGGGLAGMFLGNTAIETGYKGIEAAQDGAVTQDEMSRVKKEGAVKAGVITGVDALTLGLSKAVTNIPARAVESATRNALTKAGVNVADEAAVLAARQSPEISAAVRAAQESAFASANTLGKRAAAGGAALGLETVGEGLGEYLGELAATGKANVADAVLEAMMSLGQSGAEVAWGAARNKKAEQGGMWDTAEAKFQPPPPTLVTEPEPLQQRIDALMGIDTGAMSDKERTQYEKDLTAAFLEPVGVTQDERGLEIPFTMADYLNAQARAEDAVRARPLKQNAADQSGNRLQQLADEEAQQQPDIPGYVAPEIPVVGTLSAAANMAVQSGAHAAHVAQQQVAIQNSQAEASGTQPGKADTPTTGNREAAPQLGILAGIAAQAPSIAQPAPNTQPQGQGGMPATAQQGAPVATSPAGVEFDVSKRTNQQLEYLSQNGQPGWREAATAEIQRRGVQISQAQQSNTDAIAPSAMVNPDAPAANSASVPALKASDSAKAPEIQNGDGVTNLPTEKRGIKTIDRWSAEELQGRLDRGNLSPESEQRLRAELAKRQPVKQSAPQASPLTVGKTPNGAEPVTVRNGVVHVGDYPAIDYETEADITVPEGATPQQIADALRNGGALGSRKIFGLKADEQKPQEKPAVEDTIGWTRMTTVEREALVAKAGWTGKTRGINLGGAIVAKQAWGKMSEANRAKLVAASQIAVKKENPSAATVAEETAAPDQAPIKKDEQPKNASDRLRSGEINVEQFMEATGLTDDDVGTFSSNGARNKADAQAKKESRYHAGIEKISAAIFEAERGLTQGSTAQSRRAYQANVAKYRQAQETLGVIAKHYEHPFKNTLLSKLPPFLESRFGKQWDGIEHGDSAKRAFHGDSYRKWVDLLIGAADNKNGTPISPAVSQPKTDAAPEAAHDKAPVSTLQPDPALQNRDRGRAASVNQMQSIARNPDYMRLGPSRTPDSGAPMVFAVGGDTNKIAPSSFGSNDIAVMSDGQRVPFRYAVVDANQVQPSNFADGATNPEFASTNQGTIKALNNGRTAGVRSAHSSGNAATYTAELLADNAHGVSPEAIRNTPNPMLVRVYAEQSNTGDMAAKSQGQGLGLSASERAAQDAELMTGDVLDKFAPGDIASAGNRDFVRSFVGKLAENELADMMDATGNLSQDGRRRIEAALLTAAYGKSDLVQELFESTDTDIKAIGNALKVLSGQWASMRQAAHDGSIDPAVDMTANLMEAVNIVRRSRAEGSSIAELAGQGDLMGGNYLNELSELFLRIFYKGKNYDRARGGDKVIAALQEIVTSAMNTKAEAGLFGDSFKATPKQIVESARSKIDEENKPASQSSLFGANGQATAVSQGNRSEGAAQPGEVGQRPVGAGRSEETGKQAEPVERSIADLQKELESAKFGERTELNGILIERVTEDAERSIKQGEMPMYQTGNGTFVVLHPSAQQDGMIQATRYSDTGVFGDSQYKEVKEAVRDNGLWFKRRLPDAEAAKLLEQSIAAEAEYQERKNGASEPVAKEPWQMTRKEWYAAKNNDRAETFGSAGKRNGAAETTARIERKAKLNYGVVENGEPVDHRQVIEKAIGEGRAVPAEVLADYPEFDAKMKGAAKHGNVAMEESAVYTVNEPDGISGDLFQGTDDALPAAARKDSLRPKHVAAGNGAGSRAVLAVREAPDSEGVYYIQAQLVTVGERSLPVDRINTPEDAARAFASLSRFAVEHLDGLVTDKNGKPLAIIGGFKGAPTQAQAYPSTLMMELSRIDGAANLWLSHNHPSGVAVLSRADENLSSVFGRMLEGSSVTYRGLSAMARNGKSVQWSDTDYNNGEVAFGEPAPHSVPIVERELIENNPGSAINSPAEAKRLVAEIAKDKPGIVFVTAQNQIASFVPFAPEEMGKLRLGDRLMRLFRAAAKSGGAGAFVAMPDGMVNAAQYANLKGALEQIDVRALDGIEYVSDGSAVAKSLAEQGLDASKGASFGNIADSAPVSKSDTAIYGMASEGKSAADILKFIVSASRNPLNRQIAKLLLKTGIAPRMTVGTSDGWKFNAGNDKKYAAAYNAKANTVALFRPASAERHVLHELMHAATLKALNQKGLAAIQMKALFAHVKKTGELNGMYGMSDVDEFVAEAFTNPKFQDALKKIAAPQASGTLSSAWNWFVRIVKGILGLPANQEDALSAALEIGVGVMREDMALQSGDGVIRFNHALRSTPEGNRPINAIRLANLRRIAAGLERPKDAVFLRVTEDGKAITTGPKGVRIPETFIRFAESNGLDFEARRNGEGRKSDGHTVGDHITSKTEPMPEEYRESGALYFGEGNEFFDRTGKTRYNVAPGKINQTDTEAFRKWFGDSKVVDSDGKPLRVFHGTASDITAFDIGRSGESTGNTGFYGAGAYFSEDADYASGFSFWARRSDDQAPNVVPVYLSLKNPAYINITPRSQAASEKSRATAEKIISTMIARGTDQAVVDKLQGFVSENKFEPFMGTLYNALGGGTGTTALLKEAGFDGVTIYGGISGKEKLAEAVAFDPTQIKSAIGNYGDFDGSNPDIRYNVADEGWSVAEPSKMDDVIYALQDKQIDMKRVVQSIMKTGKQIKDDFNAYLQEELFHGRAAKGVKDFLDFELRPLLAEMQKAGIDMGDFEEYLWNRHAPERNAQIAKINPDMPDGGSGIETAKARAYLAGLSAEQRKTFEALAAKVEAMNRESQRVLIESGLEKQSTIDAWNGAYQHYVPLQREDVDSGHVGTGKGFSVRGSSTKRAMGSGRQVVDIIANLTMQRERNIVRAEKNRVSNALLGLAVQNPNPDFWKVDQAPKERVVEETAIYTVRDESGKKLDEFTRMDEAERFARQHPGSDIEQTWGDRVKERVTPGFTSRDNVLLTRINGEDHYVIFNERDERAVRMAMSMKNLDVDNMGRVLSVVGKATRYLASVNTQYNPVFGVINLIRDAQGALINLTSTPLAGEQKRVLGYTVDALRGIYADIRAHRKGEKPSSKWAALFEEFQKEGGQTGYRDQYANSEARAEAIKSELEQFKEGKAKQFTRGIFGWLSDYNETMENAVRLAAYKAAKEKGMSNQQAASLAKNITVNFNRKGQMATQVGALYAFFNASVQGTARIAETLFEQRGGELKNVRLSKVGKKIVAGGIMLGSMQAMLLAAAGFDDDEPPEFIRERNLILPIGDGKYLTMAMPLGFHVIPGIGRIATEFVLSGGKDPIKRMASFASMFAESFNPVGSAGWSLQTITPSVVDPFAALAENRDFTGKEIYREDFNKLNPTPGHARAKDVATIWSRYISEAMNFMTGGTEFKPGMFSPSPDSIDYLLGQLTGGVGREVNKAFQTGSAASTGEDLPLYKIPLVGRFVGDTEGQGGQSAKFYEAIKQINMHEAEYKGLLKEGRRQEAAAYLAENPAVKLILAGNHAELTLRKLRSQKRDLVEKDADKEQVRAIDERITATMRKFNERAGVVI